MAQSLLEVRDVSKHFGKLVAVDKLSFAVNRGEIFGIAGPNGSGKSTLFNILTGIPFAPDSGSVVFRGQQLQKLAPHHICRLGVARTFQRETVFDSLTVWENILMGSVYGYGPVPSKTSKRIEEEALELLHLHHLRDAIAGELTVFEKKRLMIASAMATNPALLLLDEPASSLTKPEIEELRSLIKQLQERGITILLIEHVLPLLLAVSQRLMVLNYGEKIILDDPEVVIKDSQVIEAYLGSQTNQVERQA